MSTSRHWPEPTGSAIAPPRVKVLGIGVSAINMERALETIDGWIHRQECRYVCVTSVHGVMESQSDPELARIHAHAGMVTPDGMPLVWLSRVRGEKAVDRVYGPDLLLACCARAVERGWRFYFYGGDEGVADRLAERLMARFPGLRVVGTFSPPFRPLTDIEDAEVVRRINASGADIVWVGLSTPKQERWMSTHVGRLRAPVLIGVGAAFDFHAGLKRQAPRWIQRSGFEWLFRLASEPRRLWRRYLYNNPRFVLRVLEEGLTRRELAEHPEPGPAVQPSPGPTRLQIVDTMDADIMAELKLNSAVKAATEQVSCDLAGETVILNLRDSIYYGLDEVGTFIWGLVQQQRTFEELRDAVLGEYDVSRERCEQDLLDLIGQLEEKGLVEIVHAEAA
jgi:N-acetylglucosaminyldiphosphoundecaprenol N-acetyl-beta-D-mannosaminyltransferase